MFVKDVLLSGPDMLGFLMASSGVGALFGAYFLASRKTVVGLGDVIAFSAFIFGMGQIILGLSNHIWLSILVSMVIGFGIMVQMASSNTILQTIVSEHMRGRVMSLFTIAFLGLTPFGSLIVGSLASKIGVQHTLLATGTTCLIAVVVFYLNFVRKDKLTYSEPQ
jgi:MFS family permease